MTIAICTRSVPAVLSPTGKLINVGDQVEYTRIAFRDGEGKLVLANGLDVPDIFFCDSTGTIKTLPLVTQRAKIDFKLHATIKVQVEGRKEEAWTYVSEDGTRGIQFRWHSTKAWVAVIINRHNMTDKQVKAIVDAFCGCGVENNGRTAKTLRIAA